ncbi:MAG: hypothetical protein ABIZ81_12175 [Opitutaceae bacterium]
MHRESSSRRFRFPAWSIVLLVVLSYVAWDAITASRHLLQATNLYGVAVDAPAHDARSATGYANGRRSLLLPAGEADTAHWIMQTQAMIDRGEWRVRRADYDNPPRGREVHWAAPMHWWLAALAGIDHLTSGRPIGISVERATLVSGPVMLALLLLGLLPFLSRQFSSTAAVIVAVGSVAMFPFYTDFLPARADHHGLANICGLLTVLFLVAGSRVPVTAMAKDTASADRVRRDARGWFIGSALAGGIGLWVSAATLIPVLLALGVGVLVAAWIGRSESAGHLSWMQQPKLFRIWGLAGGGVSLVAYLIEYFPSHFGMRLEVNHPLYALAWIAAGEVLRAVVIGMKNGFRALTRRDISLGGIAVALVVLAPAVVLMTKAQTFSVADPFIWRLHSLYISEFQSLLGNFIAKGRGWSVLEFGLPILLLLPPLALGLKAATSQAAKAQLALAWIPAAVGWAMGWGQIRWLGLAYAITVPLIAVYFRTLESQPKRPRRSVLSWAIACGLLFLPGALHALQRTGENAESTEREIRGLAERDVAHWLKLRGRDERVVVAGAPTSTTKLIYFGGILGVGTLYWENADGLRHAAEIFGASSPEAAQAWVQRLGITHIVLFSWDAFELTLARLHRNLPESAALPPDLFIANLLKASVPPVWLRAIPFKLPNHPSLAGAQVRVWEVTPNQSPAEALAHAANYYLELGAPEIAAQFGPRLGNFKDDLAAMVMLAGLASRQRDAATFSMAAQQVSGQLARAGSLALDDHIHLVVVLTVAEQTEQARAQLQACMGKIEERGLRHLTPGTLSDLLALSDAYGVDLPSPELKRLALKLVPPSKRK